MKALKTAFQEIKRYPSAVFGVVLIAILIGISIYTLLTIPYTKAVQFWRGGEEIWHENPKNASPIWLNLFRKTDLGSTIVLSSREEDGITDKYGPPANRNVANKNEKVVSEGMTEILIPFTFDYTYDTFPQELTIFFETQYTEKQPHLSLTWHTPDGREIRVGDFSIQQSETYRMSQDSRLTRRLDGLPPQHGLFANPLGATSLAEAPAPLKGTYELRISGLVFEEGADLDAKFVIYGQAHGLAGTDHRRRDLMVALLWGTPIALAFGLLAAFGTTLITMIIAAASAWFGGWVDGVIQRVTEVNLILPLLPILIMVGTFYSRNIWLMLGVIILLNIFGAAIKTYRAVFLQVKQAPYIEAARAYGAGNARLIFAYLIPRVIPLLIPQLVVLIPTYVFFEAALAYLGLGDPVLPTWGKVINDARQNGALYQGQYYWVLEPSILLMLTGLAFTMVGFVLDRIFNPKLRGL
jgi:peptide/nickel transport system permease protein